MIFIDLFIFFCFLFLLLKSVNELIMKIMISIQMGSGKQAAEQAPGRAAAGGP